MARHGTYAGTFSICALDPDTGEAGVAVASRCLAVGGLVPYAEVGVGAVATQAWCNPKYGPEGLALLRKGLSAGEVVKRLIAQDATRTPDEPQASKRYLEEGLTEEGLDFFRLKECGEILWLTARNRQVGVVDREGRAAAYSGPRIFPWFGSIAGAGFCCQGNMLAGEEVVKAMAEAFVAARKAGAPMPVRLMSAMEAGEAAGGDKRGKQAAGILIVRDQQHWTKSDRWCDVRVDDHEAPLDELARVLKKGGYLE
ncbi:MAG: DUF1028 domain-containing protein [Planctomycetota bacterium]|nr:DUF1028 domain-containing protein [Planctomycetota bacterium]